MPETQGVQLPVNPKIEKVMASVNYDSLKQYCKLFDWHKNDKDLINAARIIGIECQIASQNYLKTEIRFHSKMEVLETLMSEYSITFQRQLVFLIFDGSWIRNYRNQATANFPNFALYFDFRFRNNKLEYCLFFKPLVGAPILPKDSMLPTRLIWKRWEDFCTYPGVNYTNKMDGYLRDFSSLERRYHPPNERVKSVHLTKGEKRLTPLVDMVDNWPQSDINELLAPGSGNPFFPML
ncbi:hypothetical protein [Moorena sp. SIO3B2]|uniref:hypothetical protein n=1 Tax=Moorena sp. SIO3B2 TaxID=2607827 RepID=UPI0013C5A377|nr:hypothetical protein [Moorena sp. SIO3B2]NEP31739.1 hypothetical protein [Moorena sp. SIO3B2]NEP31764.1 hypothetical protein [Moorena sp. SIO3B2]